MKLLPDRKCLAQAMPRGGVVAEIGVETGLYAEVILEESRPAKLYLIDCWEFQAGQYEADPVDYPNHIQNDNYRLVLGKFADHPEVEVMKAFSPQVANHFPPGHFDWVYIDANHFKEAVRADLEAWWPKVKVGGFLCGHDYCEGHKFIQVKPAVDEFLAVHGLVLWAVTQDKFPSWCIHKETNG